MPIHPVPTSREAPAEDEGEYDLSQRSDPTDDEEEEIEAAPEPEPEPDPTPPKRQGGRPRKKQEQKPVGVGVAAREPPLSYWKQRNIEVLWPEILEYLRQQHRSPYDVDIRVKRTEPIEMLIGQPFSGGTVMGGEGRAASTAIVDKITDEYHMVSGAVGPATYKIEIFWRINAKVLTWGTLRLNSPDAIIGMRRQQQQNQQQPPAWQGPHYPPPLPPYAGYGAPQAPSYSPPYAGYGVPPPHAPPSEDAAAMRAEIGYLRGTLDEVMRAFREGRQPNIQPMPPAGVGTPAGGASDIEAVARRVVEILRPGLGANPVVATPTVAPTPAVSTFEASVQTIMQGMMQGVLKKVGQSVDLAIRGDGASSQPAEAVAEVIPPEDPKDHLPFESIPVGSKWPDGRDVMFPRDRETGSINMMGVAFANPFLAEKMADAASSFIGNVGDLVKNMGRAAIPGGATEVVQNIPRGAVQAGMGQQPHVQAPAPHPQVTQSPPIQRPNGAVQPQDNGGWPTG